MMFCRGYKPPEFFNKQIISEEFDIFSLSVIMLDIITGRRGYYYADELESQEFIELVRGKKRLTFVYILKPTGISCTNAFGYLFSYTMGCDHLRPRLVWVC
jgi:hypothetical protein